MKARIYSMTWLLSTLALSLGGCLMEREDVFTTDPDDPIEQCWEDKDCPWIDCHGQPSCLSGRCRVLKQEKPTMCSFGVCTADAVCVQCGVDADCERVNQNECATLSCGSDGQCVAHKLAEEAPCLQSDGYCSSGMCIPR